MLISFFKIAFPDGDEDEKDQLGEDDEACEVKRLDDPTDDEHYRTKAEIYAKWNRNDQSILTTSGGLSGRATEETRLTANSGCSSAKNSLFYYTAGPGNGTFGNEDEETKDYGSCMDRSHATYALPQQKQCGRDGSALHSESMMTDHFLIEEDTTVNYFNGDEEAERGKSRDSQIGAKHPDHDD